MKWRFRLSPPCVNDVLEQVAITPKETDSSTVVTSKLRVKDFENLYLQESFQTRMSNLETAQLDQANLQVWAKHWAKSVARGDENARKLNNDRKACLSLLYDMCDCWRPKAGQGPSSISDVDLVERFKRQRIHRILHLCLAMDRANALYNMIDHAANKRGMDWYAEADTARICEMRANWPEDLRFNDHTINKRLTWLFDLEGLGLGKDTYLKGLMQPCLSPRIDSTSILTAAVREVEESAVLGSSVT